MTDAVALERESDDRRNMTPFDDVTTTIDHLYDEAKNWASDGFAIENHAQAEQIDSIDKALLKAAQEADRLRVEEKAPLDRQIDAIQDRYNPYIQKNKGKVDIARASLKALLTAWRTEQERAKRKAAEKARRNAEEERRRAEEAIRASAGDVEARERAEEQLALADEADAFARRQEKKATSGLRLRTTWVTALTDRNAAIKHYWAKAPEAFESLVIDMAQRDVRTGLRSIPGFEIKEVKGAI